MASSRTWRTVALTSIMKGRQATAVSLSATSGGGGLRHNGG
jgi:hypothetical protein